MSRTFKLSELIIDNENPHYIDEKRLREDKSKKIREVCNNGIKRHLTWIENPKDIKSITTPTGKELTPEELFDFVIGNNITDLAKSQYRDAQKADIAIVLGNAKLLTTRERAIKAFQLYKLGLVKRILFTGGIADDRYKQTFMKNNSLKKYRENKSSEELEWQDLSEADWGAETFIEEEFNEDYQKHITRLTRELLESVGIKPEDVITETFSKTTQENAEFCKDILDFLEMETGKKINKAILVTTCTHGNRAIRQFKKALHNGVQLTVCPSTLDLERYESMKNILRAPNFDENAFRCELKRIYCTKPELTQMLREEVGHNRNVFIRGEIDEPSIKTFDEEKER